MKKKQLKVRIENGKIKPLEPLDIDEVKDGIIIFLDDEIKTNSLLKYAGKWHGEDLEQCLDDVYKSRGHTEF